MLFSTFGFLPTFRSDVRPNRTKRVCFPQRLVALIEPYDLQLYREETYACFGRPEPEGWIRHGEL
jgi:hypothetical protein